MNSPTSLPTSSEFTELSRHARYVPVYRQLTADSLTPVTAFQRIATDESAFLFESVVGGEKIGRYSFVGSGPFLTVSALGRRTTITSRDGTEEVIEDADPLQLLDSRIAECSAVPLNSLPRFLGGAVGYAAYDVIRYTEHLPNAPEDDRQLPDLCFSFYDAMVVFDHIRKLIYVVALADTSGEDLEESRARAEERLDVVCRQLSFTRNDAQLTDVDLTVEPSTQVASNFTEQEFSTAVEKCREYIKAGDIFQVVISQRFEKETTASALDVYRALRMVNPSPFMFLLRTPHTELVGSSPEIMVRVEDRRTTIRPLAGTRPRGKTEREDRELEQELLADPKERAEHVMLIDLARNDVGRVADYGSVVLSDVMVVERYSHVMHITSNVCGDLKQELGAIEALRAGLPAGTVSGAPKVRAMEIIDEIEPQKRGPYGGAVGYLDFTGDMDTCIALRTLVFHEGKVFIQAGAGIVADSVAELEYRETINKARAMMKAIHIAETQLLNK
ncbi:MAG: anthranilate synthase component I [Planctomycetaceae bacterium]